MPCRIPLSLKRKNTGHDRVVSKKIREDGRTTTEIILSMVNILGQRKDTISIDKLIKVRKFIDSTSDRLRNKESDYGNEINQKLKELEKQLKEVGKAKLEDLLSTANEGNVTNEEVLSRINKLVTEAKIEFPKDLIQNIPENIMLEVTDIITAGGKNTPNSQLHFATNELASCSHSSPLQR